MERGVARAIKRSDRKRDRNSEEEKEIVVSGWLESPA